MSGKRDPAASTVEAAGAWTELHERTAAGRCATRKTGRLYSTVLPFSDIKPYCQIVKLTTSSDHTTV